MNKDSLAKSIRLASYPLNGTAKDYDPLLELVGDARLVLLGEASHGTHEFYRERAQITKRLIREKGFSGVAVEADWPDAYRVNCHVQGQTAKTRDSIEALAGFQRFPTWMWRNADVLDFIGWLRAFNETSVRKAGFYGLDLYSLHSSMEAVIRYLDKVDPEAAKRARYRYGCFEDFGEDPQVYGYAANFNLTNSCQEEVVKQLRDLQEHSLEYASQDGHVAKDELFFAEQNARLAKNAEEYYRSMFGGRISSWNLRDCHMAETLDSLLAHLNKPEKPAKLVVWEHNSHLGDARATQMGEAGELNVGQLVRERYGHEALLVGFTTFTGSVTAASDWGGPAEHKRVNPALPGSYEALFHEVGLPDFMLILKDGGRKLAELAEPRLERAIGVIYRPQTERFSHYFEARLPAQFDAVLHFDTTRAVEPLERGNLWIPNELPETYPSAL